MRFLQGQLRIGNYWIHILHRELSGEATCPLFPFQTVNAPETELVAQPIAILAYIGVPARAVLPFVSV